MVATCYLAAARRTEIEPACFHGQANRFIRLYRAESPVSGGSDDPASAAAGGEPTLRGLSRDEISNRGCMPRTSVCRASSMPAQWRV